MTCTLNKLSFMAIKVFVFKVESFHFLKFHESETTLDKGDFKRGFTVTLKVKNSQKLLEESLKIFAGHFFVCLIK